MLLNSKVDGVLANDRTKQNRIDHAEDCGVGSNPEGEGKDHDGGEAWILRKRARSESDIKPD
jgi:hypothetical protein